MSIPKPLPFPKRYLTPEEKIRRLAEEKPMSYIAALRTQGAIVMSADRQETLGDDAYYVEKIAVENTPTFDLVIGGAGRGELIEGFIEYAKNRVCRAKPKTVDDLYAVLSAALLRFYSRDVKIFPGKQKTIGFLIAARQVDAPNELALWRTEATRIRKVPKYATIGYGKTLSTNLARRLYRENLPHGQAVLLSVYMVAVAKSSSSIVGGETQVVFIRDNGVWPESQEYISVLEARAKESIAVVDELFFICADVGLNRPQFDERLAEIMGSIQGIRKKHLKSTGDIFLQKLLKNEWPNDPYPRNPLGGSVLVKQDPKTGETYCEVNDELYELPEFVKQTMRERPLNFPGTTEITCKNDSCKRVFQIANREIRQAYNTEETFDRFPVELQQQILQAAGCETVAEFTAKRDRKEIVLQCPYCSEKRDYGFDDFREAPVEEKKP